MHEGITTTGSWQLIEVTAEAPIGTAYACVSVYSNTSNTGTAYFDLVTLYENELARGLTIENGGFEVVDTNGVPDKWIYIGAAGIEGSTVRYDEGSRSLKINDTSTSQEALARSCCIEIVEDKNYIARAKCYLESGSVYLYLEFWDGSGNRIQETHSELTHTGSWQQMSINRHCSNRYCICDGFGI